jgi:zinc transporter
MIFGLNFDHQGSAKVQNNFNSINTTDKEKTVWLHFDADLNATREFIDQNLSHLDPHIKRALFAEQTRPRYVRFENGFLLILRGINLNKDQSHEDMISLRIWIEKNRIISFQKRNLQTVSELKDSLVYGKGPKSISEFIQRLIETLIFKMEMPFDELIKDTDNFEMLDLNLLSKTEGDRLRDIRKKCAIFSRYLVPQAEAINSMMEYSINNLISEKDLKKINESYHDILRRVEDISSLKERIQFIYDEHSHAISEKMNKTMYKIAIISMIFIPISFLTGLLGINLSGIPFASSGSAFIGFSLLLSLVLVIQLIIYKKLKWI